MNELTNEELIKKWSVILDPMDFPKEHLLKVATYAEHHAKIEAGYESRGFDLSQAKMEGFGGKLLPISLRILEKIKDLSKLHVARFPTVYFNEFKQENVETYTMSIGMNQEDIMNLRHYHGIDVVAEAESMLTEEVSNQLNYMIEEGNEIYVYLVASAVSLISEGSSVPKISIRSRFHKEPKTVSMEDL